MHMTQSFMNVTLAMNGLKEFSVEEYLEFTKDTKDFPEELRKLVDYMEEKCRKK